MDYNKHLLLLLLLLSLTTLTLPSPTAAYGNTTAIYAFGDSIFDSGNNNNLPTICRANHLPYGTALPEKEPYGRFTDGNLPSDFLIVDFGYKTAVPPYLNLDKGSLLDSLATGVTFASACSGFDDLTATEVGVLSMTAQYMNFEEAYETMRRGLGLDEAIRAVETALFLVSGGTNDMLDNYYALPIRRAMYSLSAYHDFMLKNLQTFLLKLYKKGAKRIGVLGLPPLGCLPMVITAANLNGSRNSFNRECVTTYNSDAQKYNAKLQTLITKMATNMPDWKIAYVDTYFPMMDMINNPQKYGLEHTLEGCCGTGSVELGPLCGRFSPTCPDPSKYLFWDAAHPTHHAYRILTNIFKTKVLSKLLS